LNPAYQNLIAEAGRETRAATQTIKMKKGLLKHADIHLRIRTLIAEAGRETRAATQTIKMKKGPVARIRDLYSLKIGSPRF
jgi:hypothetical protein